ncbi:MAG TPA: hypothetical protein VMC62_12350, partial [Longilinea sp.]|nr:hypothetical protein [Longilinea sp.]
TKFRAKLMTITHDLISAWQQCDLTSSPYILPADKPYLTKYSTRIFHSFDEYIANPEFGSSSDTNLHVGLLPLPFIGNLRKATIFVLMLNPGLHPGDYYAEQYNFEYKKACIRNLHQENNNDEYPFIFLNPQFAWHPGFEYWNKKFNPIIETLEKQSQITYQEAMSILAKSLACLELLPYHSKSFGSNSLLKVLPSVQTMISFVHEILLPKAKNGEILIIVTREAQNWQLPKYKNIITYEGGETCSAYLSLASRGGKAIANHLGLRIQ